MVLLLQWTMTPPTDFVQPEVLRHMSSWVEEAHWCYYHDWTSWSLLFCGRETHKHVFVGLFRAYRFLWGEDLGATAFRFFFVVVGLVAVVGPASGSEEGSGTDVTSNCCSSVSFSLVSKR